MELRQLGKKPLVQGAVTASDPEVAPVVEEVPDPLAAVIAGWLCYHEATGPLPSQQYLRTKINDLVAQIREFLE